MLQRDLEEDVGLDLPHDRAVLLLLPPQWLNPMSCGFPLALPSLWPPLPGFPLGLPILLPLALRSCDRNDPIRDAIRQPHGPVPHRVGDPTRSLPARLEGTGVQGSAHRLGDLLARQEHELVGVLAVGRGALQVQHEGEAVAHLVQDELRLELEPLDGAHAHIDIGCVVHPPPAAAVLFVVVVVAVVLGGGGVVVVTDVVGCGGAWWWCMVVVVLLFLVSMLSLPLSLLFL